MNAARQEAGGIYLFADSRSRGSYLNGETMASFVNHPLFGGFKAKQFDTMAAESCVDDRPSEVSIAGQ